MDVSYNTWSCIKNVVENRALWTKYGNDNFKKKMSVFFCFFGVFCSEFFKALVTYWQFYPSRWLKQAGSEIHTRWITQAASETHTYLGRRTLKGGAKFVRRSGELRSRRGCRRWARWVTMAMCICARMRPGRQVAPKLRTVPQCSSWNW